ncbi:hypothetical protein LEMLEM_LOCUS7171 [Lemmus lemmus]
MMFYSGLFTEVSHKENRPAGSGVPAVAAPDEAAVQFIHKDSAALLPWTASSKDMSRLMETNLSKLQSTFVPWASKTNKFNQSLKG